MANALLIDAALPSSFVALAKDDVIVKENSNNQPQEVSSWMHVAIQNILQDTNTQFSSVDYVAVAEGPGSYTGLRVAMSTAKGICYALQKPMITVGNLLLYVAANLDMQYDVYVPMIDARRNEVFTATIGKHFEILEPLHALIMEDNIQLANTHLEQKICVCGNGGFKASVLTQYKNLSIISTQYTAGHLLQLSMEKYQQRQFADLAYAEPTYGKPFYFNK
jgi:tRNA threonylcarbamoyladenosine biosynthesis protein TsaB